MLSTIEKKADTFLSSLILAKRSSIFHRFSTKGPPLILDIRYSIRLSSSQAAVRFSV